MSDWTTVSLGQHCKIKTGKKDVNEGNPFGQYPFFTCSRDVSWSDVYSFDTEAILIAGNGDVGNLHYYDGKFEAYQRTYVVDSFNINIHYVYQYLSGNLLKALEREKVGTSIPYIKLGHLTEFPIYIPKLPALQDKIAGILQTIDQAIEKTEALIEKYQQIKAGLMHDLFTRGIGADGQLRPPREHAPELYQQTPIGWIPKEWKLQFLASVLENIDSGWSPACPEVPPGIGEWGVLKVSAVTKGYYDYAESKTLAGHLRPIPSLEVKNGDVIMTRANGVAELVGKCVQVSNTQEKLMLSDKLLRLTPLQVVMTNDYLALLMSSESITLQIDKSMNGSSGQRNISQADIRAFNCPVPSREEQERISKSLLSHQKQIENEGRYMNKLLIQKSGLMHDLLTGKVQVKLDQAEATHV